jgi:magnesium transporter
MTSTNAPLPGIDAPAPLEGVVAQATALVPVCVPGEQARNVLDRLVGSRHETVADVAVCDRGEAPHRLVGLVAMTRLLAADPSARIGELMDPDPPVVGHGTDPETAAWKAVAHGESSLALVDADGWFLGLVPPGRLLGDLLQAHDQEVARLGGYLHATVGAREAIQEPVHRRLWHRLPWLLLGLAGSAVAAWLVGLFADDLEADVRLAFFIPGVVYMADAVGTQTEALVIRGMASGASLRTAFRLEVLTGPAAGAVLGLGALPLVWWWSGSVSLALAVSLALLGACSVATLVAFVLPWLMQRRGKDPAFGSGPLATVAQDLLSICIYLLTVSLLVA